MFTTLRARYLRVEHAVCTLLCVRILILYSWCIPGAHAAQVFRIAVICKLFCGVSLSVFRCLPLFLFFVLSHPLSHGVSFCVCPSVCRSPSVSLSVSLFVALPVSLCHSMISAPCLTQCLGLCASLSRSVIIPVFLAVSQSATLFDSL